MIEILNDTKDDLVAVKATEKLSKDDYDVLIPLLEGRLDTHDKLRMYFEMEDFEGWRIKALWEDVKFDTKHANDFKRIAMVGDRKWQENMTQLMKPFTSADVKFFDLSEKNRALEWVAA